MVRKGPKSDQNELQRAPEWAAKRSQIDADGFRCPFGARVASMAATGCHPPTLLPAFLEVSGRDGVAQRGFEENPGSLRWALTRPDQARSALWSAKMGKNDRPEGGPEMVLKNGAKKALKMRGF